MSRMLVKLNEETEGRFDSAIRYRLQEIRYYHYNNECEFRKLLSREVRDVFRSRPLKAKVSVLVKCVCPDLIKQRRMRKMQKAKNK